MGQRIGAALAALICATADAAAQTNFREVYAFSGAIGQSQAPLVLAQDGSLYGVTIRGGAGRGSVYRIVPDGTLTTVALFSRTTGQYPLAGLLLATDGNFYGTASEGGASNNGTVYRMTPSGSLTAIVSFSGADGRYPQSELIQGSDGNLYGTTSQGGAANLGTIFRVTPGGFLTTIVSFTGTDGKYPYARLLLAQDGSFYGTTFYGGQQDLGTIFRLTPAGVLATLISFSGPNGASPAAGLIQSADGSLYGTTQLGGSANSGTVFRLTTTGTITTLRSLVATGTSYPQAALFPASDGTLYGTGSGNGGSVFRITPSGTFTELVFPAGLPISSPEAELVQGTDGYLYGVANSGPDYAFEGGGVFRVSSSLLSSDFSVRATFPVSGAYSPYGGIIQGVDDHFYGTTRLGGEARRGTVFRLTPSGTLSNLVTFGGPNAGSNPETALLQVQDGNLYGTTAGPAPLGNIIFRLTLAGQLTPLFSYPGDGTQTSLASELIQTADGTLFGVRRRVAVSPVPHNGGIIIPPSTVFRIRSGSYSEFQAHGGGSPYGALVDGGDGFLYGTTRDGGASGRGSVFKVTSEGAFTTLASFSPADGRGPLGALIRAADGSFYGTTEFGGSSDLGTIFRVDPGGVLTTIRSFTGTDGANPRQRLLQGQDGNLYGVTTRGGAFGRGTVFKVTPGGILTTLHPFEEGGAGLAPLIQTSDGTLYGTVAEGCSLNGGCVFRLSKPEMSISPPVLTFTAVTTPSGFRAQTGPQTVQIAQAGAGSVSWTASTNQPWLAVTPTSGAGPAALRVTVSHVPGLQSAGALLGMVTLTWDGAANNAGPIVVTLQLRSDGSSQPPFGVVDTPLENSTGVSGPVPFTGWALDEIGVTSVAICRATVSSEVLPADGRCGANQVFVGLGTFVEGARADVQAMFPTYPNASRAGWGLMVLTNMLPGGGNGSYRFFFYATNRAGDVSLLGTRNIVCDNANSTQPFGAIDTPGEGATVTGIVDNFGWVLSPGSARADPPGGGTVRVVIDGGVVGAPGGWTNRSDLSALFPLSQYAGVHTALGVFTFASTSLANGVHTIAWIVTDNQGRAAGVGSRYFTVANGVPLTGSSSVSMSSSAPAASHPAPPTTLEGRRGFDLEAPFRSYEPDATGLVTIQSEELDRIELQVGATAGYLRSALGLGPLPIGARIDAADGTFTWQPGAGFVGPYDVVFETPDGQRTVRIVLNPKGRAPIGLR